ncbi:GAF domain-containing protein [Methyloligella sp. 2.7D]|uniref:GAF domain-containing protein n=1 Tax=unclassified Methyloligella TaxID=2625955 RepID=UPI00157D0644|nr:GAF domain-containing protein [Methyloligella sp. GL2]QKP76553.1 GAF domain-containing protein [Methyloligella sp. GL2]
MELSTKLAGAASDDEALAAIVRHFAADSGTIHFLGQDGMLHLAAATLGMPEQVLKTIAVIPPGKGMAGLALERGEAVDACNIQTDTSGDVRPGARATELAGAIVVPLFQSKQIVGTLGIANRGERSFTEAEIAALLAAGRILASRRAANAAVSG